VDRLEYPSIKTSFAFYQSPNLREAMEAQAASLPAAPFANQWVGGWLVTGLKRRVIRCSRPVLGLWFGPPLSCSFAENVCDALKSEKLGSPAQIPAELDIHWLGR
jgi:hypothetical protein